MIHNSEEINRAGRKHFHCPRPGLIRISSEDIEDEKRCAPHNRDNGIFCIRIPDQWYPHNHHWFFRHRALRSCCRFSHAGYPGGTHQLKTPGDLPQQAVTEMHGDIVRTYSGNRSAIIPACIERSLQLWTFLFFSRVFLPSPGRLHDKKGAPGINEELQLSFRKA